MNDHVNEREYTNSLEYYKDSWHLGYFNGKNGDYWDVSDWGHTLDYGHLPPGLVDYSDDVAGTKALAQANPSKPSVSWWNFVWELKDIPEMMRTTYFFFLKYGPNPKVNWPKRGIRAQEISSEIGEAYLNWTFGWDLLIRDVFKLITVIGDIERRQRELSDLRSGNLRKTVQIGTSRDVDYVESYWGPLYQASSKFRLHAEAELKIWARIRYKPTTETFKYMGNSELEHALSLAYGLTPSVDYLWDALPWTWLIDWCTTAGDYFRAKRNVMGLVVDDVAIMRHTVLKPKRFEWVSNPHNASFEQDPNWGWERKLRTRWTGGPVIHAFIPNLGAKQLSILAALATRWVPLRR